ncbi:MAG: hypothetical protein J6T33_07770 [Bacteroidales bacterium]|nr:hypothetical protein [Bacteroidales bacterium]
MKKAFLTIAAIACVAIMAMASCDKKTSDSGNNSTTGTEQPADGNESLISRFNFQTDYAQGPVYAVFFTSTNGTHSPVLVDDVWLRRIEVLPNGDETEPQDWLGKFTYTGTATQGSGEMTLKEQGNGQDAGKATFSINGNILNLSYNGETSVLKKIN